MTTISNALMTGVVTLQGSSGTSYYDRIRVGTGSPGNAGAAGTFYCTGAAEFDSVVYFDGDIAMGTNTRLVMVNSNATAYIFGTGSIASPTRYQTFDTLTEQVEFGKKLEYATLSGIANQGVAGLKVSAMRQGDWFKYPLGSGAGVGGALSAPNPYSGTACFIYDLAINITGDASGAASHVNVGVTSGASNVADVVRSAPVTSIGTLFRKATASAGGSGTSGRPVLWGATNKLLITPSAGGVCSALAGAVYVLCKKMD